MTCEEVRSYMSAHLDGELDLQLGLATDEHLAFCMPCQWACAKERELRTLLRTRLPQEPAPVALRERIRVALRRADRSERWGAVRLWRPRTLAAAALVVLALGVGFWRMLTPPPVIDELVSKHLMYSRVETPAEVKSASQETVSGWFKGRVRFDVAVPDFSPSGVHLIGGRLSALSDRQVAYLLYEKGRSLVSFFAFRSHDLALPAHGWVRGKDGQFYVTQTEGVDVVIWTQGDLAYALVSSLDRESLLQCADSVWRLVGARTPPGA